MLDFYQDGFVSGCAPKSFYTYESKPYRPGGPWVMYPRERDKHSDPKFYEMCLESVRNHEEWHRGFDDGRAITDAFERITMLDCRR